MSPASVLIVFAIAAVFYLLLPGLGAIEVRRAWRTFRQRLAAAARMPLLTQATAAASEGPWRLLGTLEAVQAGSRVWLAGGGGDGFSVAADLEGVPIYVLPWGREEDREPQIVSWRHLAALPSGTPVLVAGRLESGVPRRIFRSTQEEPLLVVFYEGEARTILPRAVRCGRQRNEYWNHLTSVSLLIGALALLLVGRLLLREPVLRGAAVLAYALAAAPLAVFLPPGVVLYFAYRSLWKRARALRAERDLLRLPLIHFEGSHPVGLATTSLPDGESYVMLRGTREQVEAALAPGAQPEIWDRTANDARSEARDEATLFGADLAARPSLGAEAGGTGGEAGYPVAGPLIGLPRDPMAGLILVVGDPETLARRAAAKARRDELAAVFLLACGLLANSALVLYILRRIVW